MNLLKMPRQSEKYGGVKHVVANLLLNLAKLIGDGNGNPKLEDRSKKASSIAAAPAQTVPPSSLPVEAMLTATPLWGCEEAKATAAFLNSTAGQLFSKRVRSVAGYVAIEGAKDRVNTIHSAGVSAGWDECVRYIHSLATCQEAISRVSGEQDNGNAGRSSVNDRHQPLGEAELLERLSP